MLMKKVEKKPIVKPVKKVIKEEVVIEKLEKLKDVVVKVETPVKEYIGGKEVIGKRTVEINGKKYIEVSLADGTTVVL